MLQNVLQTQNILPLPSPGPPWPLPPLPSPAPTEKDLGQNVDMLRLRSLLEGHVPHLGGSASPQSHPSVLHPTPGPERSPQGPGWVRSRARSFRAWPHHDHDDHCTRQAPGGKQMAPAKVPAEANQEVTHRPVSRVKGTTGTSKSGQPFLPEAPRGEGKGCCPWRWEGGSTPQPLSLPAHRLRLRLRWAKPHRKAGDRRAQRIRLSRSPL